MAKQKSITDLGCAGGLFALAVTMLMIYAIAAPSPPAPKAGRSQLLAAKGKGSTRKPKKKIVATWTEAPKEAEKAIAGVQWKQIFFDDFERKELGKNWVPNASKWGIRNGELVTLPDTVKSRPILFLGTNMAGDIHVSYICHSPVVEPDAGDLSFFYSVKQPKKRGKHLLVLDSYFFRFGSYDNTYSGLSFNWAGDIKAHNEFIQNREILITPAEKHEVKIWRLGRFLKMTIDGRTVFAGKSSIEDKRKKSIGGLYTWNNIGHFDDFSVSVPVK
ncbi:MAG: hypothetical protein ACYTGH_20225 [Planctomycetota bacterium]|jgi:hypothetical protein